MNKKAYYNTKERALKFLDICIHCGKGGSKDFLLGQQELEARNKTGGRKCYPICIACLDTGKMVVTYPKKKTSKSQKRKEDEANKAAAHLRKKARK